jgi:hypothetical protein
MKTLKLALAASLLLGTVSVAGVANAAVIGFDIGNVAVGYSDGYYDSGHHWHKWARHDDMVAYQHSHGDGYHEWRHDDKHHH